MPGAAILAAMSAPVAPPVLAEEPVLRRLKAELARLYGPRLERVILFGSRARGDARPATPIAGTTAPATTTTPSPASCSA
jgi:hypothetical protein